MAFLTEKEKITEKGSDRKQELKKLKSCVNNGETN